MTVRASHDIRETFARVSHNVRVNFNQFYFVAIKSRNGLICVSLLFAYLSHCADRRNLIAMCANVCEGMAMDLRHMRRLGNDFCHTKKYYMFKALANCSRPVRDACDDFVIPCERLATV